MRAIMRKHLQKRRETRLESKVQKSSLVSTEQNKNVPIFVPVSGEPEPEPVLEPEVSKTDNFDDTSELEPFDEGHPAPVTPEIEAEAYAELVTNAPDEDSVSSDEPAANTETAGQDSVQLQDIVDAPTDSADVAELDETDDELAAESAQNSNQETCDAESGDEEDEENVPEDSDDAEDEPENGDGVQEAEEQDESAHFVESQCESMPLHESADEDDTPFDSAAQRRAAIVARVKVPVVQKPKTQPVDRSQLPSSGVVMQKRKEEIEIWPSAKPFFEKSEPVRERRVITPKWQENAATKIVEKAVEKPAELPTVRAHLKTYEADDLLSPRMKAKKQLTQSLGDKLAARFPSPQPEMVASPVFDDDSDESEDEFDDEDDDFLDEDGEDDDLGQCDTCERDAIIVLFGKKKCEKCASFKPAPVEQVVSVVVSQEAVPATVISEVSTPESVVRRFLDGRGKNTLDAYRRDLDAFAAFTQDISREKAAASLFSKTAPEANALILDWMNSMNNAGLSSATVARRLATLRSMVKVGRLLGAISWSLEIESPKVEPYRDTRGPSVKQLGKLLQSTDPSGEKGVRDRAMLLTTLGLGLRRAELAGLRRADYDVENKRIFVRGKGKKNLWLTVPDKVCEAIDDWMQVHADPAENAPLFCSLDHASYGTELSPHGVYYIVTSLGKKAGVKVKPHGLRHAAITMGLDATGGDYRKVQRFSRHSDPKTILKYDDNRQDLGADVANEVLNQLEDDVDPE